MYEINRKINKINNKNEMKNQLKNKTILLLYFYSSVENQHKVLYTSCMTFAAITNIIKHQTTTVISEQSSLDDGPKSPFPSYTLQYQVHS